MECSKFKLFRCDTFRIENGAFSCLRMRYIFGGVYLYNFIAFYDPLTRKKKHGYIWTYQNDKIHIHKNNVFEINKLKHVNQYMYCMNHMGMLFRH